MDRFTADSTRRSIVIVQLTNSLSLLWSLAFVLLQLTSTTETSIIPLPVHHLHHHSPHGLHSPVRWTKSSLNSRHGRPVNVMTDVINDLGVKILDRYLDNNGNVAFSPSGLGFVLVALYEGSAGSSNREISDVLGLPRDRRVTRIGLRDIHRRLRSYLNANAFLGGLTLNREDINLRPDYEDILRFYGFDISDSGLDNNSTSPEVPTKSTESFNLTTTTITPNFTTIADSNATTVELTTAIPLMATTDVADDTNSTMSMRQPDDGSSTTNVPTTTDATNSTSVNSTNVTNFPVTIPMSIGTTSNESTDASTTLPNLQDVANSTDDSSTIMPMQRLVAIATDASDAQIQSSDGTTTTLTNPTLTTMTNPTSTMTNSTDIYTGNFDDTNGSSTTMKIQTSTNNIAEDTATNAIRKRRGILHGPSVYFSGSPDDGIWYDEFRRLNNHDDYSSTQDDDIVVDTKRSTEVAFLVNGCDYSRVTAAAYTASLPFSYYPSLRASLLEFPLDDPRYKILVMLPSDENGTRRLARLLSTEPITLRRLRRLLQSTWVNAIIPSFMLRGFVTLTPYLQRLGISDVFDPRAADLTPMSPDLGVYARDIQQSIGVNIRNNVKGGIGGADGGNEEQQRRSQRSDDLIRRERGVDGLPPFFVARGVISPLSHGNPHYPSYPGAGDPLYGRVPPLPFVVDRPFLYFIIDDETSVTLLAGRIDDPLNSRML